MRARRLFGLQIIFLFAWFCNKGKGFGTINEPTRIGQHCEHERLTRAAFACPPGQPVSDGRCFEERTLMQLAGTSGPEGHIGMGTNGAVGAPDLLDPTPEGPEAHCDNADFLDAVSLGLRNPYPQTRQQATAQLQACVDHLRERFGEGLDAADGIVDEHARIIGSQVDISTSFCRFSFPELQLHMFGRSKCSAIEGFGRALHGVQDFYAHSNWADDAKPPFGLHNPPGLKRDDYPMFLDLRGENDISDQVPYNLSTGCFGGILTDAPIGKPGHPLEPGSLDCTGRVTHHTMNKDNGLIDPTTGITQSPGPNTPRSKVPNNFQNAVFAAIKDTRRQWRHFREELRRTYGTERGNIIICSLVRDIPTTACYGRRIVILRDARKGTKGDNRITEMQIPIHRWILEELEGHAHYEGEGEGRTASNATKSKGSSDEMQAPQVQADGSNHDEIPNLPFVSQGLDVANSLTELIKNATAVPTNKSAIVALTNTQNHHLADQIAHIWRAGDEGIRVHLGLLPPSEAAPFGPMQHNVQIPPDSARQEDLITAVLRTGGTFSILHNEISISSFLDHVISRGLTQYDNARDTATLLLQGLTIGDYVTPESEPRRFSFDAHAMDNIIIAVAPITPKLSLHVIMRHVRRNKIIKELDIGLAGNAAFRAELGVEDIPRGDAWFELEVAPQHIVREGMVAMGLFEVSLETEDVGLSDADKDDRMSSLEHSEL